MFHSPVRLMFFLLLSLLPALAGAPERSEHSPTVLSSANRAARQPQAISPTSVPVFVSDFELFAVGGVRTASAVQFTCANKEAGSNIRNEGRTAAGA